MKTLFFFLFRDFGEIFAELLPGNFAKLQPPDGQDLMDGLEVKVQLGPVWKQSLTELSGGQRCVFRSDRKKRNRIDSEYNIDR
jgi:chromosome segregation ATPase